MIICKIKRFVEEETLPLEACFIEITERTGLLLQEIGTTANVTRDIVGFKK